MASLEDRVTAPADDKHVDWAEDKQLDGASENLGGSGMQDHEQYDVEVKLVDENSPLYSVKSFEELGL